MAESTNEWECSKENIQPLQQGRKAGVLKGALAPHPEDVILQQRQAFEQELRTYSGHDPLDVWWRYIKWVEQNFPTGGKEGHFEQLIQNCLSIFKEETKYFNDERFIDIWIKFANLSTQPLEIYDYMYSNNIGCKSAKFYISWAWDLEQLGNFKKADEVLHQGIYRKAEPFEKLKTSFIEFESRFVNKVKMNSEMNDNQVEAGRSAFSILKSQKKNSVPIMRTGDSVVESNKILTLGGHQPQPKNNISTKKPFHIFNSENIAPSLPVQSENVTPFVLYAENSKENEKKPGKWNKVKVKQKIPYRSGSEADKVFKFHCDDSPQPSSMPRKISKVSNILSAREASLNPPMALFEPPDATKRPMYDKNKVYGGAKEFSFEEIRSAAWQEKKNKLDQEQKITEQEHKIAEQKIQILEHMKKEEELKKMVESLTEQINHLQNNKKASDLGSALREQRVCGIISNEMASKQGLDNETHISNLNGTNNNSEGRIETEGLMGKNIIKHANDICSLGLLESNINKQILNHASNASAGCENIHSIKNHSMTDDFQGKSIASVSYREAANMVQDLYNGTLSDFTNEVPNCVENEIDRKKDCGMTSVNDKCPSSSSDFIGAASTNTNHELGLKSFISNESKVNLPFLLYHDPTEAIPAICENTPFEIPYRSENNAVNDILLKNFDIKSLSDNMYEADVENMPPKGYIQETSKRELAGILEPSKNIPFLPLDQQELDDEDNEAYEAFVQHPLHNETLVPPSNTEQFSAAISLPTSTPFTNKRNGSFNAPFTQTKAAVPLHSKSKNEASSKFYNSCLADVNNQDNFPKSEVKAPTKESNMVPGVPNIHLSVIMETSRECYSKSSSSSSSSSNLTKSSQFDQHSINRKQFSKLDIFRDPSMLGLSKINSSDGSSKKNLPDENICCDTKVKEFETFSTDDDPFDQQLITKLLSLVPHKNYGSVFNSKKSVKTIKVGETLEVGNFTFIIEKAIGEGAYAKIYEIRECCETLNTDNSKKIFALKVCKNADEWEVYICSELHKRLLEKKCTLHIRNSIMNIISVIKYEDGIAFINDYSSLGTMLDMVNLYKKNNSSIPEYLVMYMTLQILHTVTNMHECNIIHGDVKPDNFLMMHKSSNSNENNLPYEIYLRLIDFGRAIDLSFFRPGVCFTEKLSSKYQCNEMKDNKPWVFQLDWYGVLNCIHTMLFSEYITVKKRDNKWEIEKKFKRYWLTDLWQPLFNELLNIPSCYEMPDVKKYIDIIECKLQHNTSRLNSHILSFYSMQN